MKEIYFKKKKIELNLKLINEQPYHLKIAILKKLLALRQMKHYRKTNNLMIKMERNKFPILH